MEGKQKRESFRKKAGLLAHHLRPAASAFALGIGASLAATLLRTLFTQIIRFTVDHALLGETDGLPAFLLDAPAGRILVWCAAAAATVALLEFGAGFVQDSNLPKGSERFVKSLRDALYGHIQRLPYSWHVQNPTGDIIQRCTSDVEVVRNFIAEQMVELLSTTFLIAVYMIAMFAMNVKISLFVFAFIPVIVGYSLVFYKRISKGYQKADEAEEEKGPLILKGVNLTVEPHEKVGVVGRTGAGKSTMMIALFRITDLCEGSIAIDGIDLATLGLEDVRRALCIIPQDPVLFSASVRFNLDPFNEASDEDIWSVLEQVELKDAIERLPRGLDDDVQEGGSNFSVGERQLICMARALLKHPKILIMDEATASLDNETDTHLQHMIRKQFATCTGLTIAHRLNTIMDVHRVCVMDKGMVAEYDTPANLLRKEGGIFRGMVIAANDPTLFDMVPGCEDMKELLKKEDA